MILFDACSQPLNLQQFSPRHPAATHPHDLQNFPNIVRMIQSQPCHLNSTMTGRPLLIQADVVHIPSLLLPPPPALLLFSPRRHRFTCLRVLGVKLIQSFSPPTRLDRPHSFVHPPAGTGNASARLSPILISNRKDN